nr:hypothetical protein [Tanacetum cinerariifolium]
DPTNETDMKSYSIEGFAWAIKGQLPVERLVPDETEARSRWWVSSRAYFDGRRFEDEQIPRHLNRNNYFEVPSEMYREFKEQRKGYQQMKEKNDDMIDKTKKKDKTKKLSPRNLGNNFADENVSVDNVTITGVQQTDNYFNYETVDPDKVTRDTYVPMTEFLLDPYDIYLDCYMKGYKLPIFFWPQLVPHLCTYRRERSWPEGWLSSDNGLNDNDQDSLNATAGGNVLSKTTREALQIIKNKLKVRYSRNKPIVSRMNTTSRENASKTDDRIEKLADQISTLVDIFAKKVVTPALVKAFEESCVTCGEPHAHYNCDATSSNQPSVCVATGTYNQVAPQNRASNYMAQPGFAPMQNSQNRFNQNQGQGNNFN